MKNEHFTVKEVSDMLNVSHETVRRYIRENKLPAIKIKSVGVKKVWGISPKDLDEFNKK